MNERIVALDVGDRRIGIAVSDAPCAVMNGFSPCARITNRVPHE